MEAKYVLMAAVAVTAVAFMPMTADAAGVVYTDEAAFAAATSNPISTGFSFPLRTNALPSPYVLADVTFTGLRGGPTGYNDGVFGSISYISVRGGAIGGGGNTFTVSSPSSALGLHLGSFNIIFPGFVPYTYTFNGISGTIPELGRNPGKFLGFVNSDGPVSVTFGIPETYELAVTRFITAQAAAVPEPASWALMLAGFGLAGAAMRRRVKFGCSYA